MKFVALTCFTFLLATAVVGEILPKVDKQATIGTRGFVHVVFNEIVSSKVQTDWTKVYNAKVQVFHGDKEVGVFRGSTLPNFMPPPDRPAYEYSVVLSTGSMRGLLGERFYTWKETVRADGKRRCLRLSEKVPTINVGSARLIDKIAAFLRTGAISGNFNFASDILVHCGQNDAWRGSAGCLTIHPDDCANFFGSIPEGSAGTLALLRGIEDSKSKASYSF